ncbi:MAG: hypothetical protein U0235_20570 [Polyangiaceae bacterium]
MSRTRVPFWTPPFTQAVRMALRPALTYLLFSLSGAFVLLGTLLVYEHNLSELWLIVLSLGAGILGVVAGQLVAVARVRGIPIYIASTVAIPACTAALAVMPGASVLIIPLYFFCFAFPCGFLSLQHRWELVASFWPAVGWIGAAVTILNAENRVHVWEGGQKAQAWLVVPLIFLACFLVLWLFFLASKQALRVELWQALSGSARRRVSKKAEVTAIPRRNVLPILVLAAVLFVSTALLAPYLWRTAQHEGDGRGESGEHENEKPKKPKKKKKKPANGQGQGQGQQGTGDPQGQGEGEGEGEEEGEEEGESPPKKPELDEKAIARELEHLANAAKESALHLWPLLLLFLFYRPAKRALLLRHLQRPIVPTPPSERIENLWEVVRIAAQDRGIVLVSSDSIEDLLRRLESAGALTPPVREAAAIYERARYGFTLQRGEVDAMRRVALAAAADLRRPLTVWEQVKIRWRRL